MRALGQDCMKIVALGALLAAAPAAPGVTGAAPPVRTNYQITIENGQGKWAVTSSADVVSGRPIEHDLGRYRVSLLPTLDASGGYVLTVAIGPASPAAGAIEVADSEEFEGRLGYPLEFEATAGGQTVSGAIMMSPVE